MPEITKLRIRGLKRENLRTDRRKLQDAEFSIRNRYHILSGWKSNGRQSMLFVRMEEVSF